MAILYWRWFYVSNSLFKAVSLTENPVPDKYPYFGCDISFDICGTFWLPNGGFGMNVVIFGVDMSPSVHTCSFCTRKIFVRKRASKTPKSY